MRSRPLVIIWMVVACAFWSVSVCPNNAFAEGSSGDATVAQTLFERARTLMEERDFEHACPLLAESQRIDPGGGTLLNLALCHERQGKTATAWAEFNEAMNFSTRDNRPDQRDFAREHIDALSARVPRLRVIVDRPVVGLVVRLDDGPLSPLAYGLDTPVNPGRHVVSCTAPGYGPWAQRRKPGLHVSCTTPTQSVRPAAGIVPAEHVSAAETELAGGGCVSEEAVTTPSPLQARKSSVVERRVLCNNVRAA